MQRREVTPRTTTAALVIASQSFHVLARQMSANPAHDPVTDQLITDASIQYAGALTYLGTLARKDKRFEFEVIRASMLEFLPALVLGLELTPERVLLAGRQLDLLAQEVQVMIQVAQKPMTMASSTPANGVPVAKEAT